MTAALDVLAGLVLEDGRRWGTAAQDFQRADAEAICTAGGPRRHYLLRARGMSKTGDVAGLALGLLLTEAPPRSRSYAFAADQGQAALLLDTVAGYVVRTPDLTGAVEIGANRVTVRATGATLTVESSDAASSFGTKPWLVLVDEMAQWPAGRNHRLLWASIISALPKVRDSRLVVLTSAGQPDNPARERWERACASPDWRTSLVAGPCPWWTDADVAAAKADLTEAEFRRFLLCEWAEGDDSLSTAEDVAACVRAGPAALPPVKGSRYVMTLDVGTRRDATVVAVAHAEQRAGGRVVVVDRVVRWEGSQKRPVDLDEVEASIRRLHHEYFRPTLRFDRMQAEQLTQRLRMAGITAEEFMMTSANNNRMARALYGALRDRAIELPDDPALVDEFASVRMVETAAGMVAIDSAHGGHDDQVDAVGMALVHLLDQSSPGRYKMRVLSSAGTRVNSMAGIDALALRFGSEW